MIPLKQRKVEGNRSQIGGRLEEAKEHLRVNGWSYRRAAAVLACHPMHLAKVMTGVRSSQRLLDRVLALGPAMKIPTKSIYRPATSRNGSDWS